MVVVVYRLICVDRVVGVCSANAYVHFALYANVVAVVVVVVVYRLTRVDRRIGFCTVNAAVKWKPLIQVYKLKMGFDEAGVYHLQLGFDKPGGRSHPYSPSDPTEMSQSMKEKTSSLPYQSRARSVTNTSGKTDRNIGTQANIEKVQFQTKPCIWQLSVYSTTSTISTYVVTIVYVH